MAQKIFDISVPVFEGMPVYPGDAGVRVEPVHQIAAGDAANLSELRLGSHTGTHVDAPLHFVPGGESVDRLSLESLVGEARVLDLTAVAGEIAPADLEAAGGAGRRLLLKTANSGGLWQKKEFSRDYVSLSNEAADYLVAGGVRLVGIDYLSVERFHPEIHHVHGALLGAGIVVLEGLDLSAVPAGDYLLVCLPLKIRGGDGAPARAVLISA